MAKKSSNNKSNKNVKTAVVVSEKKHVRKKKYTPSTKKKNTSNNITNKKNNENVRSAVVVAPPKKQQSKNTSSKNIRDKVVVAPKKTTLKKKKNKQYTTKVIEPKLEEFVPIPSPEETSIPTEPDKVDFESKINSIIEFEIDEKKDVSLDDIDVLKFPSKDEKTTIKKKTKSSKTKRFSLQDDISSSIDKLEKTDEKKIEKEFEEDLLVDKKKDETSTFKRKRKGKNYVINIHKTKTYKELEDNLRQLYDRVNDVVQDFDTTVELEPTEEELEEEITEKPSFLDKINQKALNVFLIILFIIFFLMCVAFVAFVIYVSTV